MLELIVDKAQSLKVFTENNYAQAAFFWNALLKDREIKVNGKRISGDYSVFAGDRVSYYLTPKQEAKPAFYRVYEDENVIVVDKESGVNSEAVFAALSREGECYFLHRLDRNTGGLLVFARSLAAERSLLTAFRERGVEKRYHALCFGTFPNRHEVLSAYLKKDAEQALVRVFDKPVDGGERIVTEYKVLEDASDTTKVEVTLHTGKTHQIRAHLAHIGCPIIGDMKYGNSAKNKEKKRTRQCLVAKYLRIFLAEGLEYLSDREFVSRFEV